VLNPNSSTSNSAATAPARALAGLPGRVTVPDGTGGVYVAWEDTRDGLPDIYLLRVTNAGAAASGWPASGVAVCSAPGPQFGIFMIPDGSNGVILAWQDLRNGWFTGEGFAQRVSSAGVPAWTANGISIGAFTQLPSIAADGSGGMLVAWSAGSPADIRAVRFNSTGAVQAGWSASGTVVCAAADEQLNPVIAHDNAGGAILAWEDFRSGLPGDCHVWGQRLNASAAPQWTANGIKFDGGLFANDPAILPDGSGGALLCWWQNDATGQIHGQRVNSAGAAQWAAGVDMSGALDGAEGLLSVGDGLGGMIAYWGSPIPFNGNKILAQRVNASGVKQWGASAPWIGSLGSTSSVEALDFCPDGAGGAFYAMQYSDPGIGQIQPLIIQYVTSTGTTPWAPGGIGVSTTLTSSKPSCRRSDRMAREARPWAGSTTIGSRT
jgi:hypothetical protein